MGQDVAEKNVETLNYGEMFQPRKDVKVIKKDGSLEKFNVQKVIDAVGKGHALLICGGVLHLRHHVPVFVDGDPVKILSAALQQVQLNTTNLGAGLFLEDLSQNGSQTAQLGMAEAVGAGGLGLGDEGAVGIVNALRDGHQAAVLLLVVNRYVYYKEK